MKDEIFIAYIVALKYNFTFKDLMTLRYSSEANDRVKYEMLVLTVTGKIPGVNTNKMIESPSAFSDFIEEYMPLDSGWLREKLIRLIAK